MVAQHELLLKLLDFKEDRVMVSWGHGFGSMAAGVSKVVWIPIFSQSRVARASETARLDGWKTAAHAPDPLTHSLARKP